MAFGESLEFVVGVALTSSATGRATEEDEEDSGRDRVDLDVVKPRNTPTRPLGREESGEDGSSPPGGDMCSVGEGCGSYSGGGQD
jgi:hypothetical protein